ncbi:MAG: hypothetical protein EXS13_14395, partial [Planctomycetes bacterium]|nr:hypothetical protein [Planctomycetota bacterium]
MKLSIPSWTIVTLMLSSTLPFAPSSDAAVVAAPATVALRAPQDAVPPNPAKPDAKADAAKPAADPSKVDLRSELATLDQVWKRRTALHFLKNGKELVEGLGKVIDPTSAQAIQALLNKKTSFDELDYHLVEKIANCEQRVLNHLRGEKFRGVADLLEVMASKNYPLSVAHADLMGAVELNWRYAARKGLLDGGDSAGGSGGTAESDDTRALGRRLLGEA